MKKLLPGMLALLILICSCSAKKSFLHQRYTNYDHKKSTTVTENRSYANRGHETVLTEPETVVVNPEPAQVKAGKLRYTKSVMTRVVLPIVLKGKEKVADLTCSNSKQPVTKLTKVKQLNLDKKHEKRGLLWGVIDAILAMILLVVFVMLVVWLLLVLT